MPTNFDVITLKKTLHNTPVIRLFNVIITQSDTTLNSVGLFIDILSNKIAYTLQ